jgi:AAA+ superfamily predicted ATPase
MHRLIDDSMWQPLGTGLMAPAGSVTDATLAARLATYKRNVAGTYRSVSPVAIATALPPGPYAVSPKVDGETWFLWRDAGGAVLLSPGGKAITSIPVTEEAARLVPGWSGLVAGELYAAVETGRPRVFDLHAALGGGSAAAVERLRFAAFDLLIDDGADAQTRPFAARVQRLHTLFGTGRHAHCVTFDEAPDAAAVQACFDRIVTTGGAEGIVVRSADHRVFKVKPELGIDAAVVAYGESGSGPSELLLALLTAEGDFQLIGRVRTGWSRAEQADLAQRLGPPAACASSCRMATDRGTLLRWVRPELVVEVKCNDLLAADSHDEPIRRMRLLHSAEHGWEPVGPAPSVSMINSVYVRVREDKQPQRPDVRLEQVTDLVPVGEGVAPSPGPLLASAVLRRDVYVRRTANGTAVRKVLLWRTNKHEADSRFPAYCVAFTDFSPNRAEPLKTELRVASAEDAAHSFADDWLAARVRSGWELVARTQQETSRAAAPATSAAAPATAGDVAEPSVAGPVPQGQHAARRLTIGLGRSSSPTFPIVRRRLDALASLGNLTVTRDDRGRESWYELLLERGLVENARRIANLLGIVRVWKTTEVALDGEALGRHDVDGLVERLDTVRRCWLKHKAGGPETCRRSCPIGCAALRLFPSHEYLGYAGNEHPPWYAVGSFDGESVTVDKTAITEQVTGPRNAEVRLCPHYDPVAVGSAVAALPDRLSPEPGRWITVYHWKEGAPAWVWPKEARLPSGLRDTSDNPWRSGGLNVRVDLGQDAASGEPGGRPSAYQSTPARRIPRTRYADVRGQDAAVEAVRDLVELPLRHADLFARIGATAQAHGIILAGPPGTGKSLLARAVAGESGAHVEVVSGPALLSKWVGETEAGLRGVFERARALAPSVILFDEIDCLAGARASADAQYQKTMVTQLLALLDGLESRGQVFVIATTNRPQDIDAALTRPGRFDRTVLMGPPDVAGREAIFLDHMQGLVLAAGIDRAALAAELAAATRGCTGADVAFACRQAALLCVKEAAASQSVPADLAISAEHFRAAVRRQERGLAGAGHGGLASSGSGLAIGAPH